MADFQRVAELSDIAEAGDLMYVEVDGEPVCLANANGDICAFTDICTHIGGPLSEGELDDDIITCPLHGAVFDVTTGQVSRLPAPKGVSSYNIRIEGGDIEVEI